MRRILLLAVFGSAIPLLVSGIQTEPAKPNQLLQGDSRWALSSRQLQN
jgi:hypothetical protein